MLFEEHLKALSKDLNEENARSITTGILQDLFKYFYHEPKMQSLILRELTGSNQIMSSIHNVRELIGQQLLEKTDDHFKTPALILERSLPLINFFLLPLNPDISKKQNISGFEKIKIDLSY